MQNRSITNPLLTGLREQAPAADVSSLYLWQVSAERTWQVCFLSCNVLRCYDTHLHNSLWSNCVNKGAGICDHPASVDGCVCCTFYDPTYAVSCPFSMAGLEKVLGGKFKTQEFLNSAEVKEIDLVSVLTIVGHQIKCTGSQCHPSQCQSPSSCHSSPDVFPVWCFQVQLPGEPLHLTPKHRSAFSPDMSSECESLVDLGLAVRARHSN